MFNVSGGFDVVIGNPPYISAPDQLKDAKLKAQREALARDGRFSCLVQKWDLYIAFMELSIRQFLKNGEEFTMIVPYPLTNQTYGAAIRKMLLTQYALKGIVDLQGVDVFENATVTNCIPLVEKSLPLSEVRIIKPDESGRFRNEMVLSAADFMPDAKTCVWKTSKEENLLSRFQELHRLGDYCYVSKGMVINADEKTNKGAFTRDDLISETKDRIHCREYIEAKDIGRYEIKRVRYLEYGTKRCPGGISRPTFPELYTGCRVLVNGFGAIQAILDDNRRYLHNHTLYALVPWCNLKGVENNSISGSIKRYCAMSRKEMERLSQDVDERFLVGLLNSQLWLYLLNLIRGGDFHIYAEHLRAIPVAVSDDAQSRIAALVDQVLAAKARDGDADTASLEAKIDKLVYELYGLTDEEIEVVERKDVTGQEPESADAPHPASPPRKRGKPTPAADAIDDDEVLE